MIARLTCVLVLALGLAAQSAPPMKSAASYRISGTVVSFVTGQPLADVKVSIYSGDNNEFSLKTSTGADGHFAFSGLAAAKYSLFGSAYGYRTQGFHQHGDFFIGIAVGPALDSENLTFRLVPDARIEGVVTDEDNEPVRNASATLYQRNTDSGRQLTRAIASAATDDRGHYNFGHLAPGTYFVAVSARPWYAQYPSLGERPADPNDATRFAEEHQQLDVAYPMTFYPSADDSSGATAIALHPGDRLTADVVIRAMPAVHLRVNIRDKDNNSSGNNTPRGFPRVSQRVFEGTLVPVLSAQSISSPSGEEYTGIAPGHYVIEMPETGGKRAGWYKELDLSGTVEIDARENPPLVSVTGALMLEGGARPTGKIYVVLANRASAETFVAEVTAKGNFDFNEMEVRPGTYDVVLNNAPGVQIKSMLAKGARAVGQTLEISGNSVQLVLTATHAVARIDGVVVRDDKPFAGAMVVLVPASPSSNLTLFRRDQSDSDGTFTLREVLPGPYTAIAVENGWELDWANPATLQPYLKAGTPIEVTGEGKLSVKVQLQ